MRRGSQAELIAAASFAETIGVPLNRLLTIRLDAIQHLEMESVFSGIHPADGTRRFLDLFRRWVEKRGLVWAAIWVRERAARPGEHLHVGFHLRPELDRDLARQLARWTGAAPSICKPSKPTIARAEERVWDLSGCVRGNTTGAQIAAYLGKAEPNTVMRRGRISPNTQKPRHDKHDPGGVIEGTRGRAYRSGTSRSLGPSRRGADTRKEGSHGRAEERPA